MKKTLSFVLSILMLWGLVGCQKPAQDHDTTPGTQVQIPNPLVTCDTPEEAAKIAGFSMNAPESIDGYKERHIQVISGQIISIIYQNGDHTITIRKAAGTDDISGDFNSYESTEQININGINATLKYNADQIFLATWTTNGYTYSISIDSGMTQNSVRDLILSVS